MKAWVYLWRLLRFSPGLYAVSSLLSIAYSALPLAIGLVMRAFFNALTGETEVGLNPWTLVVLYLATTLGLRCRQCLFPRRDRNAATPEHHPVQSPGACSPDPAQSW